MKSLPVPHMSRLPVHPTIPHPRPLPHPVVVVVAAID